MGHPGPQGPKGDQGRKGATGAKGDQGFPGYPGETVRQDIELHDLELTINQLHAQYCSFEKDCEMHVVIYPIQGDVGLPGEMGLLGGDGERVSFISQVAAV